MKMLGALAKAVVFGSGAPPKAELRAIEARREASMLEVRDRHVMIYGVTIVGRTPPHAAADSLAEDLRGIR